MTQDLRLYSELASWWPLFSAPGDYEEAAGFYREALLEAGRPRTVLELGSGGGNNASHLKRHFDLTLVDRSPAMLDVSRRLNPECAHVEGDMRSVRLDRQFDAVFLHDAIMHLTTASDLALALETAFLHCRPGGAALLAPDCFRETFVASVTTGGHDGRGRSLRHLEWTHDPDPSDDLYSVDFAIILRVQGEPPRVVADHHVLGLFERGRWLDLCRQVGFEPGIRKVVHSELAPRESEMILCRKPPNP